MLRLHANTYALPSTAIEGPKRSLRGLELPTLVDAGGGPPKFWEVFPVSFETTEQRLTQLPRCDCEPDGFALITGHTAEGVFWRLNAHLNEFQPEGADEPSLHRIELAGECPEEALDSVLRAFDWPETAVAFELVREGVSLGEEAFREWARVNESRGEL